MQVRFARHTDRFDQVVAFYRDGVGLPEIGRFEGHDGYDGVFLDLPGAGAHLELTRAEPANPYWAENGVTLEDQDGFRVVLVPREWAG